jgi:hypothetical protein
MNWRDLTVDDFMMEDGGADIREFVSIDKNNLDEECAIHAEMFAHFVKLKTIAYDNRKRRWAEMFKSHKFVKEGKPPSDAAVNALIEADEVYRYWFRANYQLEGICDALKARKGNLSDLVTLYMSNYYSVPVVEGRNVDRDRDVKSKMKKRSNRKGKTR